MRNYSILIALQISLNLYAFQNFKVDEFLTGYTYQKNQSLDLEIRQLRLGATFKLNKYASTFLAEETNRFGIKGKRFELDNYFSLSTKNYIRLYYAFSPSNGFIHHNINFNYSLTSKASFFNEKLLGLQILKVKRSDPIIQPAVGILKYFGNHFIHITFKPSIFRGRIEGHVFETRF